MPNGIRSLTKHLAGTGLIAVLLSSAAYGDDTASYLKSARELEKAHNLRGAEIQLRNAAEAAPENGSIRVELAKIYLQEGNANAAEAELFAAHTRGVKEEETAPLLAQAMLELGTFGDLLKNIPAGNRPPKIESLVRSYRGVAEMSINELNRASAMFADAERLDPTSVLPLVGETRLLIAEHKLDEAWKKADEALKRDPKSGDALDAKGLILAMRGQPDAALKQFGTALAIDPENLRALLDRADLLIARGNLDAAQKDLETIGKRAPGSAMAIYLQAVIDAQRGKLRDADALLDKLRGTIGRFPQAYLVAAQVKFQLNQLDQAQEFVRRFISQAGAEPKAYQLLGAIALKRGDIPAGIAALEKAVQLAPNDAAALGALGQAYIAHGDMDKAKAVFDRAALQAPGNAPIATERAITQFATGDREAGLQALSTVFNGGKGSMLAGPPLVIEALQLGQVDVAEATARELVARDPANTTYGELLAAVRVQQRDYAGAETLLRTLLAKNPGLVSARRDLAQVYLATNRAAQAKQLYQDRLRSKQDDADSLEALADLFFREGNDAKAVQLLTQEQNAAPQNPRASLHMLSLLAARKKWPDAIARARALQSRFPNDASVADAVAHLYWASGNHAAAAAAYKSATAKFSNNALIFAHYAAVLASDRNYAGAAPLALRAVQIDPRNPALKIAYVSIVYLAHGTDAALAASQTVTSDKTGTAAWLVTANVLDANRKRAEAISLLEKRQAQSPSTPVAVRLAALYQRDNQLDKALLLLEPWAAAHPNDGDARFMLAQLQSAAGKFDRALDQYEWLAVQKPDNPVILNNLAWLYDSRHDPRARATAEKAIKLAPASGSVADTLGWILVEQGDTAGAMKYLAQASATQPADGTIQYHYAFVLSKAGKVDQAREILQKLLKENPRPDTKSAAETLLAKLQNPH